MVKVCSSPDVPLQGRTATARELPGIVRVVVKAPVLVRAGRVRELLQARLETTSCATRTCDRNKGV